MTTVSRIALFVTAASAASATAFAASAQSAKGGKGPGPDGKGRPDPAALAAHLSAVYVAAAPYDLNVNGTLETSELEQLADALEAGTVTLPAPAGGRTPPADAPKPPVEHILPRVAEAYATVAPYDANVDAKMIEAEIAALQAAIESGVVQPPAHGGKGGPGGKGGKGRAPAE